MIIIWAVFECDELHKEASVERGLTAVYIQSAAMTLQSPSSKLVYI